MGWNHHLIRCGCLPPKALVLNFWVVPWEKIRSHRKHRWRSHVLKLGMEVHHESHTWRIIPVSKWLGSPPFISAMNGHLEGVPQPQELGTKTITMVINHLLNPNGSMDDFFKPTVWLILNHTCIGKYTIPYVDHMIICSIYGIFTYMYHHFDMLGLVQNLVEVLRLAECCVNVVFAFWDMVFHRFMASQPTPP